MRIDAAAVIVMIIWYGIVVVAIIDVVLSVLGGRVGIGAGLKPVAMGSFGWLLSVSLFSYEAREATQLLKTMTRGIESAT